jgi:dihydroorotate dehydrogenase
MINRLIIGAPFGNYLTVPGVTSTLGTFTLHRRAGWLLRLWRIISTVRPLPRIGAWVNKLGLPNPGIDEAPFLCWTGESRILSVHGFDAGEWMGLAAHLRDFAQTMSAVELNLSCPNVRHNAKMVQDVLPAVKVLQREGHGVIAKLPPLRWRSIAEPLFAEGVRAFHCCNTIPTPGGGLSGKPLKQYALWAVEDLRELWGRQVVLIGGGGVTTPADALDYIAAGADHVAIASMALSPFRLHSRIGVIRDRLNEHGAQLNLRAAKELS